MTVYSFYVFRIFSLYYSTFIVAFITFYYEHWSFSDDQMSSSNQGFKEEEESPVESGQVLGRARALVDYTPSPYDKDGLAFKVCFHFLL